MSLETQHINLGSFSTVDELVTAANDTFARLFGWQPSETESGYLVGSDPKMMFCYGASGSYFREQFRTINASGDTSLDLIGESYTFHSSNKYYMNFIRGIGGGFAFSLTGSASSSLRTCFAKDTSGNAAAAIGYNFASAGYGVGSSSSALYNGSVCYNVNACVSIVKVPNLFTGEMMANLYKVVSAPSSGAISSDVLLYISGRYYRLVGNSFVIPVG